MHSETLSAQHFHGTEMQLVRKILSWSKEVAHEERVLVAGAMLIPQYAGPNSVKCHANIPRVVDLTPMHHRDRKRDHRVQIQPLGASLFIAKWCNGFFMITNVGIIEFQAPLPTSTCMSQRLTSLKAQKDPVR